MPLPLWALMAGVKGIQAVGSHISGNKQADRMNKYATDLSAVTPNERDYMKRQRGIAEGGDPFQNQLMSEQMNRVMGNIRQTGAENLQRAEGSIIGQGMENSIVASELRRKVNKDTLRNIGEQSRRITSENRLAQEQTKRQAEDRLYQAQQGVDARGRQAMGIRSQIPSRGERNMQLIGSLAQTGMEAYQSSPGFAMDQFNAGKDLRMAQYEESNRQQRLELARKKEYAPSGYIYGSPQDTTGW